MNLQVLYEDNHLIAVNKAAGVLSQSDATGDRTVMDQVKAYIKFRYDKPGAVFLGSIHRLDRPVFRRHTLRPNLQGFDPDE